VACVPKELLENVPTSKIFEKNFYVLIDKNIIVKKSEKERTLLMKNMFQIFWNNF
jgi:hypothetical protein